MTTEQVQSLNLGIAPINDRVTILVESAFDWINDNTTLEIDCNDSEHLKRLPANVKLFVIKYFDLMMMSAGVTSESIGGISQSFDTVNKDVLLWQYAESLLGKWLKSQMSFVPAKRRWQ